MEMIPLIIGFYFSPILAIIFCLNLVEVIKKVKNDQPTSSNSFWMTVSFALIVWTICASVIMTAA
ncbi:hypothetical protein [Sporosarcina highlanderae]|uniref:PCZ2.2 n=1 Tax=Sporosarcina highlanderae TaxID=3035916 RepID=A0ABT8JV49_9BACL|nr:hypothetical protein [Sporosarcina highlanderae]MDN4608944.1 hypothetical protein [Sporosarcina highlanderae]